MTAWWHVHIAAWHAAICQSMTPQVILLSILRKYRLTQLLIRAGQAAVARAWAVLRNRREPVGRGWKGMKQTRILLP